MRRNVSIIIAPSRREVVAPVDTGEFILMLSQYKSGMPDSIARLELFKALNGVIVPNAHHVYVVDKDKDNWFEGNYIYTTNIPIEKIRDIDRNYSQQKGYEYLITVFGNRNQYKPCEIHGRILASTNRDLVGVPLLSDKSMHIIGDNIELRDYVCDFNEFRYLNGPDNYTTEYKPFLVGERLSIEPASFKDSFSRKQVIELCQKAFGAGLRCERYKNKDINEEFLSFIDSYIK